MTPSPLHHTCVQLPLSLQILQVTPTSECAEIEEGNICILSLFLSQQFKVNNAFFLVVAGADVAFICFLNFSFFFNCLIKFK